MKSFDYIKKYKSNINFNVLKRLFADDGIELTNEIIVYLKTTPWNTNLNMLRSLIGNSGGDTEENIITNENDIPITDENDNQFLYEEVPENLLSYPWANTTKTMNGITFTDNGDGSITINGTSTGNASFELIGSSAPITLEANKYLLKKTDNANVNINIFSVYDGSSVYVFTANKDDAEFTTNVSRQYTVGISMELGVTVNNLIVTPELFIN